MNFQEALNVKVEEIEKPPLPPLGQYIWTVTKRTIEDVESKKDGTVYDVVNFTLQASQALDSVDPEQLENVGGVSSIVQRLSFMFPRGDDPETEAKRKKTEYRMRVFFENHLGMDISGMNLGEAIDSAVTLQCMGDLKYRPDPNDPEIMYAEIGKTAPIS